MGHYFVRYKREFVITEFDYTVKLGCNEQNFHSQKTFYYIRLQKNSGYNEQIWSVPSCSI